MMSKNDERKIIDSLANDKTLEMKPDDLEQMLSSELAKPDDQINAQLVQEILDALEPSTPDPAQMRAAWPQVKENLPKRREKKGWPARLVQFAAAAAVVSIVLVSTIEDAGAFRWTLIQKFLKPVAETFGIINEQIEVTPEATDAPVYSVSDAPSNLVTYAALDEIPEIHNGYIIRPKWLPEGFTFSSGSCFSSIDADIFSLDFTNQDKWFNLYIHITTSDSTIVSFDFERTLEVPIEETVGLFKVTFYRNAQDKNQLAFWINENAHCTLGGELTPDEIIRFIENYQ